MAGRRHKDFRSGDLNEELGVLLLKCVAAVAPVPRPEDVGIDAVATLLRDAEKDLLIAENSFYVQFKSSSERKIKYIDHEVRWLESLRLPFFIGCVRKKESAIDLFATHRLSQAFLETQHKEVHLLLDPESEHSRDSDVRSLNIGPPLLSWTTHDLADPDFVPFAYSILKPYLDAEQRNIEYRGIRYIEIITWQTGNVPKCEQSHMLFQSTVVDDEIRNVFRCMAPHVHAVAARAVSTNDRHAMDLVLRLIDYMRGNGFDPDPHGVYGILFEARQQEIAGNGA
jgi:hypothetical protein